MVKVLITTERLERILKTGKSPTLMTESETIANIEPVYVEGFDRGELIGFYVSMKDKDLG